MKLIGERLDDDSQLHNCFITFSYLTALPIRIRILRGGGVLYSTVLGIEKIDQLVIYFSAVNPYVNPCTEKVKHRCLLSMDKNERPFFPVVPVTNKFIDASLEPTQ